MGWLEEDHPRLIGPEDPMNGLADVQHIHGLKGIGQGLDEKLGLPGEVREHRPIARTLDNALLASQDERLKQIRPLPSGSVQGNLRSPKMGYILDNGIGRPGGIRALS